MNQLHPTSPTADGTAHGSTRDLGTGLGLLHLLVLDGLINGEDETGSFGGSGEGIDLDQGRLPDVTFEGVGDALGGHVDTEPGTTGLGVTLTKLGEEVGGIKARVITQLTGDNFEGTGVGTDNQLLLPLDGTGVVTEVGGEFHLGGTTTGHD